MGEHIGEEDKENDDSRSKTGETTESARTSLASAARLAMLDRRFGDAESLLLSRGRVAAAVAMWRCLGRLDNAAACARRAPAATSTPSSSRATPGWLKNTGQEEAAGVVLEKRGDAAGAVRLFLKGGVPGRAAALAIADAKRDRSMDARVVEEICDALKRASMHGKAGERLFDALGRVDERWSTTRRATPSPTRRRCSGGTPARRAGRTRSLPCTRGGATT